MFYLSSSLHTLSRGYRRVKPNLRTRAFQCLETSKHLLRQRRISQLSVSQVTQSTDSHLYRCQHRLGFVFQARNLVFEIVLCALQGGNDGVECVRCS